MSVGTIAKSSSLKPYYQITYLTSIVHIFSLNLSIQHGRECSIFFSFKAFGMFNMMAFVDFGLLIHRLSESSAWLDAPSSVSHFPGCEVRTAR